MPLRGGPEPCNCKNARASVSLRLKAPHIYSSKLQKEALEAVAAIHPFRALRPPADKVGEVAAVPYDVVNTVRRALWQRRSH